MGEQRSRQDYTLPSANANFTLPSLYDDLELDCRLYFPRRRSRQGFLLTQGCAVFAHPYAPLGGCYDDPVVNSVGSVLLRRGYLLVTFNFRGADQSPGRTSWSGRAELGDYTAVYAFCLSMVSLPGVAEHMTSANHADHGVAPVLLLGGYSYGSMIAAHLPKIDVVHECLQNASDGSSEKEIENRALELGNAFLGFCEVQYLRGRESRNISDPTIPAGGALTVGGYESSDAARKISRDRSRRKAEVERVRHSVERVRRRLGSHGSGPPSDGHPLDKDLATQAPKLALPVLRFLLVSPLLGPIASLATMFSRLKFERRITQSPRGLPMNTPEELLTKNASFTVYGTADHFTSSTKVRAWCATIQAYPGSAARSEEIQGAGHFWHDPGFETELTRAVGAWLDIFDEHRDEPR